uniref:Uncharacterized protein n=1 Tax=Anguilla anguilla TaxID=7936 RepID=A0A0E9SMA2_ANGAN
MNYPQSFECVFVACPLVQGGATDHELENPYPPARRMQQFGLRKARIYASSELGCIEFIMN